MNEDPSLETLNKDCAPFVTNYQMGWLEFPHNATAYPCGAIAKSFFNDSFSLSTSSNQAVPLLRTGLAYPDDHTQFKKNTSLSKSSRIDIAGEDWLVWSRLSTTKAAQKPYARLPGGLPKGSYKVVIVDRYPVNGEEGGKSIVLGSAGPFGSTNNWLSVSNLVMAAFSFVILVGFISKLIR